MSDKPKPGAQEGAFDYAKTLFLPQTDFPMRANLPEREKEILAKWERINLYKALREKSAGRAKFILHDGPPYANGNIHIGHALNKILKDIVTRAQQMQGFDSNYVPGWDCHGLPIEWKIEEQYRAKGQNKDDVPPVIFREECRKFAAHWMGVQSTEFQRLGITGDWQNPYSTMAFAAEARITAEIFKFVENGTLYRGSKPVMWSVVEKTALAEAEIEYHDYKSDTVFVAFPIKSVWNKGVSQLHLPDDLKPARIVIWTTTPWTIPANRAICYSGKISYGLYEVVTAPDDNWIEKGQRFILADALAASVFKAARLAEDGFKRLRDVKTEEFRYMICTHPLRDGKDYDFLVPLLEGDHVTDDTGTGFVHTAPGHGREDYDIWIKSSLKLANLGIDRTIPYTVDADGFYTKAAPGFKEDCRVLDENGKKGNANVAVIEKLVDRRNLVARGTLKHQYPHSWRSRTPVIYRNTPQWFIAMDKPLLEDGKEISDTIRDRALNGIAHTTWVPASGQNRITGMITAKPDWVISRQRAWGTPIALFVEKDSGKIVNTPEINAKILKAFETEGADAWFQDDAKQRFLPEKLHNSCDKITDVIDVWFDSGSTHAFVLEDPNHFPSLAGIKRKGAGGQDVVMYLEGSDQHRGWFHSSLIESCATRGQPPYDIVLTHGFVLDEKGAKMSKSLGNVVAPQKIIADAGADILRLWVAASDYSDDLRIGPEILKTFVETYRKIRNTLRWMLGNLAHQPKGAARISKADYDKLEGLEQYMLHKLFELNSAVLEAYQKFDYKRVMALIIPFLTVDLSAFYFDIRKDCLYCDAPSSAKRAQALAVIGQIFHTTVLWLAPILVFTSEEAFGFWQGEGKGESNDEAAHSVHLQDFPNLPDFWQNEALAAAWETVRKIRGVVTAALEIERANKKIGSSLEACPLVYVRDAEHFTLLQSVDFAEICITSGISLHKIDSLPEEAFTLKDVPGIAVLPTPVPNHWQKCARSWRYFDPATAEPDYPQVTPRDAAALRELNASRAHASLTAERV